jgi:CBS domain containing-hemolysin-like protein
MIVPDGETFAADARASLEDVSEALGRDLAAGDLAEDVDTLGGLVVTLAGRVPARGELITGPHGLEFEVLDADPRRLKRVRIHLRPPAEEPPASEAGRNPELIGAGGPAGRETDDTAASGQARASSG